MDRMHVIPDVIEGSVPAVQEDAAMQRTYEFDHRVSFGDTNVVGNVYFANYFRWMGECREAALADMYPEFEEQLHRGFGLATEYAHIDYRNEARLFDRVKIGMRLLSISRSRMEFEFEFAHKDGETVLAIGRQAVVWVNSQHRPALMPDRLYEGTISFFEWSDTQAHG